MIVGSFPNLTPVGLSGYSNKLTATAIELPTSRSITPTIQIVLPVECCQCLLVFGGGTGVQNDYVSFLTKRAIPSDSVIYRLYKNDVVLAALNNNTLGVYSAAGTWTTHMGQENYVGFEIDWDKVYTAHGIGSYRIHTETTVLGVPQADERSECYALVKYDDTVADGTVKFEWTQSGNIISNQFNYAEMNWVQHMRANGKFGQWKPTLETDTVIYSNRRQKQVQDELINEFSFESRFLNNYQTDLLVNDMMLAGEILVTDFNVYNHRKDYIEKSVRQKEISSIEELEGNVNAVISLKFTDKFKNNIKQGSNE